MTKSSYLIGLALALLAHAVLLLALPRSEKVPQEAEEKPRPPIRVAIKEEERPGPDSRGPHVSRQESVLRPPDQHTLPDQLQSEPNEAVDGSLGETASEDAIDANDTVPNMQIVWSSPAECRTVAKTLGMKIVGVTTDHRIAGEISLSGEINLIPFDGDLSSFSNRVRSLPVSFFGRSGAKKSNAVIVEYWILVPTDVDRLFSGQVRRTLHSLGHDVSEVRLVKVRVNIDDNGDYFLDVAQIDLFS